MKKALVSNALKKKIKHCLSNIPVTINTHFGDPFQQNQWEDTLYKLAYLKSQNYQGEVGVSTKWILSDEQIETLYEINPDLWVFCGVTGLNEGISVSLEERLDHYLRVCEKFEKTVLNVALRHDVWVSFP